MPKTVFIILIICFNQLVNCAPNMGDEEETGNSLQSVHGKLNDIKDMLNILSQLEGSDEDDQNETMYYPSKSLSNDEEDDDEEVNPNEIKRAPAFLRYGKRSPAYLRFGRGQAYLRFGKRSPAFLRFGKRGPNPAFLRFGKRSAPSPTEELNSKI